MASSSPANFWAWLCSQYFGNSEPLMCCCLIFVTFQLSFWIFNGFLLYIDSHDTIFDKYRLQKKKPKVSTQPIYKQILRETVKQQVTLIMALPAIYYLLNLRGISITGATPSLFTIGWQLLFFILVDDALFFWVHYALHNKYLFNKIHHKHHEYWQPNGLTATLSHPIESLIGNQLPAWLGCILVEKHIITVMIWLVVRIFQTTNAHCGYDLPYINPRRFLPHLHGGSNFHDHHHMYCTNNYGSFFTIWDRIMGTYKEDKQA